MLDVDDTEAAALATIRAKAPRVRRGEAGALTPKQITKRLLASATRAAAEVEPNPDRAKHYVMLAVLAACPTVCRKRLAIDLRYKRPTRAHNALSAATVCQWWNDTAADHVLGSIVAPLYEERAN